MFLELGILLFLYQRDSVQYILVEVLDVHFHAHDFGEAELAPQNALVFIPLNLLDFSVKLGVRLLEELGVIDLLSTYPVVGLEPQGLSCLLLTYE